MVQRSALLFEDDTRITILSHMHLLLSWDRKTGKYAPAVVK
jgi:hypothetical protein